MGTWIFWVGVGVSAWLAAELLVRVVAVLFVLPIFERRPPFHVQSRCHRPNPRGRDLQIPGADGLQLAGSLVEPIGRPQGLIVFCPEFEGTHSSVSAYLGPLVDAGFALLAFDFRNQGDSDHEHRYRPSHWLTEREVADVEAVFDFIADDPLLRELPIGLFGASRGGNAALALAARTPAVKAVVAEGAFSTDHLMLHYGRRWAKLYVPASLMRLIPEWHMAGTFRLARRFNGWRRGVRYVRLEQDLHRLAGRPTLLISGARDSYVGPLIAEQLRKEIGPDCPPVWVVPNAKHNGARWAAPEEFERRLIAFYDDALGGFSPVAEEVAIGPAPTVGAGR